MTIMLKTFIKDLKDKIQNMIFCNVYCFCLSIFVRNEKNDVIEAELLISCSQFDGYIGDILIGGTIEDEEIMTIHETDDAIDDALKRLKKVFEAKFKEGWDDEQYR